MSQTKAQLIDNLVQALSFVGTSSAPANGVYLSATNQLSFATNTAERLRIDSAGQLEAVSLGSASAPTYSWTTDPDTGVYSPGANQVAISTGGSGRLFVDASGRVGVGTASPGDYFYQANQLVVANTSGNAGASFVASTTGTSNIVFADGTAGTDGRRGLIAYYHIDDSMRFNTAGDNERLRITSDGKLGLGTSSPADLLNLSGGNLRLSGLSNNQGILLVSSDPSSRLEVVDGGSTWAIQTQDNLAPLLINASTLSLQTSGGRVGIGTISPGTRLSVADTSPTDGIVAQFDNLTSTAGTQCGIRLRHGSTSALQCDLVTTRDALNAGVDFAIKQSDELGAIQTRFYISETGRVGIGTTSPAYALDVKQSNTGNSNTIAAKGGTNGGGYFWETNAGTTLGAVGYGDLISANSGSNNSAITTWGSQDLLLGTNRTERARIDSSGRLLVGTSTSRSVASTVGSRLQIEHQSSAGVHGLSVVDVADSAQIAFGTNNNGSVCSSGKLLARINFSGNDGTDMQNASAWIEAYADATWGNDDVPGRLVFSVTADGASSPSEAMRISNSRNTSFTGAILPSSDNAYQCGAIGQRWSLIYAANGTIQTSDQRDKTEITEASLGSDFIKSLKPVSYKFVVGSNKDAGVDEEGNRIYEAVPGKRTHWGFIAQEVKEAADEAGVDFGGWVLTDTDNPDSPQGLRYDQFIAPLTKALQEALAEIDILKAKVAALEAS